MEFRKYNSIENSYQLDFLNEIREQGFCDQEFVVQEKVHGANICFITDGKQIQSAKRTELIFSPFFVYMDYLYYLCIIIIN